jgi:hypothetical protein
MGPSSPGRLHLGDARVRAGPGTHQRSSSWQMRGSHASRLRKRALRFWKTHALPISRLSTQSITDRRGLVRSIDADRCNVLSARKPRPLDRATPRAGIPICPVKSTPRVSLTMCTAPEGSRVPPLGSRCRDAAVVRLCPRAADLPRPLRRRTTWDRHRTPRVSATAR